MESKWLDPEIIKPNPEMKYKCWYCTFSEPAIRYCVNYIVPCTKPMFGYKVRTNIGYFRVVAYER